MKCFIFVVVCVVVLIICDKFCYQNTNNNFLRQIITNLTNYSSIEHDWYMVGGHEEM